MKTKILTLALALVLILALAPAAFAAETVSIDYGTNLSNVTSTSGEFAADWHETNEDWDFYFGDIKTYYCDAPAILDTAVSWAAWWNSAPIIEDLFVEDIGISLGSSIKMVTADTYLFEIDGVSFYVVVGGSSPAPAPAVPAPGSTAALKTTDGLYNAIPPSPVVVTSDVQYKVPRGDTLTAIARKYGTTADQIRADNKAYFDSLAARNRAQGTRVALEAGVTLNIKAVTETKDLAYRVQKGESLWGIAFNYYGSMQASVVNRIYAANAAYFQKTKGVLEAGAVITLPGQGLIQPVTQGSLNKAAGLYLVQKGDTLGAIARRYYGDVNAWRKIQEANADRVSVIGGSPMIYTGQWLVIPE